MGLSSPSSASVSQSSRTPSNERLLGLGGSNSEEEDLLHQQLARALISSAATTPGGGGSGGAAKDYDYLLKVLLVGDSDVGKQEILAGLEDGTTESPFCSSGGAGEQFDLICM